MSLWLLTKPWEDPSCRIEYLLGKLNLLVLPSKYLLTVSRISEISMEVAEPGRITAVTPPAHLIEKCDCPPGYSGLSCEVSWLQLTCLSPGDLLNQLNGNTPRTTFNAIGFTFKHTFNLLYLTFHS